MTCSFAAATARAGDGPLAANWALVVATVATVTYLVGALRQRQDSPEQRADRIRRQVTETERR